MASTKFTYVSYRQIFCSAGSLITLILLGAFPLGARQAPLQGAMEQAPVPTYFKEESKPWWRPDAALDLTTERVHLGDDVGSPFQFTRTRSRLRLRWGLGDESNLFRTEAGITGYLSSESNKLNLPWQDNERNNGGILDVANVRFRWLRANGGVELRGGLLENPLLSSESLWDADLRITGGAGKAFLRSEGGLVQEAGVRALSGDVRLLAHGQVRIQAAQAVLRLETGPFSWSFHVGPWRMEARNQDATNFLRSNPSPNGANYPDGGPSYQNPIYNLFVVGAGVTVTEGLPFEIKALRHENRDTNSSGGRRGQELQIWIGPRNRTWWPQVGYIRQQLDAAGALASVNGDQWWFHANADGERYVIALSLPARFRLEGSYVYQRRRDSPGPVERADFSIIRRF